MSNPSSLERCNSLQWCLEEPLEDAYILDPRKKQRPAPREILSIPLPVQSGDTVCLGYTGLFVPLPNKADPGAPYTFGDLLKVVEQGLQERISPKTDSHVEAVYAAIGKFKYKKDRLSYVRKFEEGKLKPKHILGEDIFFHGGLHRGEDGSWSYEVAQD